MVRLNSFGGRAVLGVGFVAGLIDQVGLPLWIGTLMGFYKLSPAHAGITVTAFLLGVVVASAVVAPLFERLHRKSIVVGGYAIGAASFFAMTRLSIDAESFAPLALMHAIAGTGAGAGLSVTDGAIGRSVNPHRLFGILTTLLGVFGVLFFATVPALTATVGAHTIFAIFGCAMALAAVVALLGFPAIEPNGTHGEDAASRSDSAIPGIAWFIIFVVICLNFNQSMTFSFVERIGNARGFPAEAVGAALVVLGFVNLLPGALAALLQKRLSPIAVGIGGPVAQALLTLIIVQATSFLPYAVAVTPYVFALLFTHTFLFGLLSKIDPSGRTVAATPAMAMIGSAAGPAAGGTIVAVFGYQGLGWMATLIAVVAISLMFAFRSRVAGPDLKLRIQA